MKLTDRLLKQKILVKEGERLVFQHHLVRGYLASLHLVGRWKSLPIRAGSTSRSKWNSLLSDPAIQIDANWRAILQFTILEVRNVHATEDLMFAVLNKNREVAGDLFNGVKGFHPDLLEGWADDFTRAYGEAALE